MAKELNPKNEMAAAAEKAAGRKVEPSPSDKERVKMIKEFQKDPIEYLKNHTFEGTLGEDRFRTLLLVVLLKR